MCGDNRFVLIEKYKRKLINSTNIETSPDEMAVLDDILFRCWQMGWLDSLEKQTAKKPKEIIKRQVYDPEKPYATIDVTQFTCPCCDGKVMFRKTVKRCLECGQLLDWGDNE